MLRGSTVGTVHLGKHLRGFFRRWIGGELKHYSELWRGLGRESRERMIKEAEKLRANAIIEVKYITTMVATDHAFTIPKIAQISKKG